MSLWDKYLAPGDQRRRQNFLSQHGHGETSLEEFRERLKSLSPQERRELLTSKPLHNDKLRQEKTTPALPAVPQRIDAAARTRRKNAVLYGGLVFTAFSLWMTRRTLLRKRLQMPPSNPSLSTSATPPAPVTATKADGALEAVQALNIATINVFSIFMVATGAAMTYFDVADIEDMREQIRGLAGYDVYAGDSAADREIEGWVAEVLAQKEGEGGGLREGVARKIAELQKREKNGGR